MHRPTRARALAGALAVLLAGALPGCSDDSDPGNGSSPDGREALVLEESGDVPGAVVLPDEVSVSQDGGEVLADCWEGICRWDATDGSIARVDTGSHVAISPDWSLLAGVGEGAAVVLVDRASGDVLEELDGHVDDRAIDGSPIRDIAFSPDGSLVASAGSDGSVIVWSVADGAEVATLKTEATTVAFSQDGERLAAGGEQIVVFDVTSGEEVATLTGSAPSAAGLAWSPDGKWLAGTGPGRVPAVWDTGDFALAARLDARTLADLDFSPDSRSVAVTTADGTSVWLWAPKALSGSRDASRELVGHTTAPGAVAFSPDGLTLYSVAGAEGVLSWDVRRAALRQEFELPER